MKSPFLTILVVILIAAIGGVYYYRLIFQNAAEYSATPTNSALLLINRLQNIKIDPTFFENPDYRSLRAYPQGSLDGIEKGRSNPYVGKIRPIFLPVGGAQTADNLLKGSKSGKSTTTQTEPFIQ